MQSLLIMKRGKKTISHSNLINFILTTLLPQISFYAIIYLLITISGRGAIQT